MRIVSCFQVNNQCVLRFQTNMPATTKQELERRVKALELDIERLQRSGKEDKLYKQYKYIRFVGKSLLLL